MPPPRRVAHILQNLFELGGARPIPAALVLDALPKACKADAALCASGRTTPTGSVVSLGFDLAQLDIGFRDHWWSPLTDSSMLLSTEAPTMPSVTLSNSAPLTRLGLRYELFVAWMSKSDKIELTTGSLTSGYPKIAGSARRVPAYGDALSRVAGGGGDAAPTSLHRPDGAKIFVDVGVNASRVNVDLTGATPRHTESIEPAPELGIGARRAVSEHQDLGFRLEADDIHHRAFYNFRALDYRYRFDSPLALGLFGGAARYNLGTPAYGFTFGTGAQWRNLMPGWDLGLDYLYGIKVARLRVLPTDVQGGTRPDSFYDIDRVGLTLSRRF